MTLNVNTHNDYNNQKQKQLYFFFAYLTSLAYTVFRKYAASPCGRHVKWMNQTKMHTQKYHFLSL